VANELAYTFPVAPAGGDVAQDFVVQYCEDAEVLDTNVGSRLPAAGLKDRMPFVRVNHFGGDDERLNLRPTLDIEVFASTYVKARDLARLIETRLVGYPFRVDSGGSSVLVDQVEVLSPTVEVEWQQDSTIRRFQGTYQFSIRR
jgi:hypothetical protein